MLAPRTGWTLVDPTGVVASFDSPEALRESLAGTSAETASVKEVAKTDAGGSPLPTDDDAETPIVEDDLSNAEAHDVPSSAPSQLAPTTGRPTVRILRAAPPLPPPPPRRRTSSTPPADSATTALGRLPTPSPLPPRVDASPTSAPPAEAPPNATLRGIGKAPSAERASQVPVASESTRTLGAILRGVDAFAESGGSMPVAPSVMAASTSSISEPQSPSKNGAAALENDADHLDAPRSERAPLSDEAPSSEDAIPLHRLSTKSVAPESESALRPVATSMTTRVADDVTGEPTERRPKMLWTEDDDEGLAIGPPVRRGGWLVAGALIAAAAGLVFYLQRSSQPSEPRSAVATTTAPVTQADSPRTAVPPPTTLVAFSTATTNATPTSLVPQPDTTPGAITTTTNADTAPTPPQTAASPPMTEPLSEDLLPTSELLHRAHASLREGDRRRAQQRFRLALAKDPSNVEAMTGLGDVARAENDFVAARDHYQHAIDRSPLFVPALLALADIEWDLGERSAARKNYATTVDKLGERAPARAKERKGDSAPKP